MRDSRVRFGKMRHALMAMLVLTAGGLTAGVLQAQEVTAERLAAFLPEQLLGADPWKDPALSHIEVPGHQRASVTQYYLGEPGGTMEIVYYDPEWSVYEKRVEKAAQGAERRKKTGGSDQEIEVGGFEAYLAQSRSSSFIMVNVGGAILVRADVNMGKSGEKVIEVVEGMDLAGLTTLLE